MFCEQIILQADFLKPTYGEVNSDFSTENHALSSTVHPKLFLIWPLFSTKYVTSHMKRDHEGEWSY